MSIKPPSDLILDVVKAADPNKAQAIALRLKQVGGPGNTDTLQFADALEQTEPPAAAALAGGSPLSGMTAGSLSNATALSASSSSGRAGEAHRRFEAMVLSNFVESMLPKSNATLFGAGTAGQVWRSMLAERIANEVAQAGGIGLAERLGTERTRNSGAA